MIQIAYWQTPPGETDHTRYPTAVKHEPSVDLIELFSNKIHSPGSFSLLATATLMKVFVHF